MNRKIVSLLLFSFISLSTSAQIKIFSDHISLGVNINSTSDELNLVISPDGNQIFFTRKNHIENVGGQTDKGDIWVSEKNKKGEWTPAYNLKSVNNKSNNRIIGFMDAGRAMLVHAEKGFGFSYNLDGKWLPPTPFKIPYFKSMSKELSGSISADGRYLLFGMESFGSYGVEDIYVCRLKTDGSWTSPKSLGAVVNTPNQEITPFLAADNKTLFYASNGMGGEGSFDIFMSTRLDDTWQNWSKPKNLGNKVNTPGWERSFVFASNDEFAYLVSTQNSDGYGDLKKVKIIPNISPEIIKEDTVKVIDVTEEKKIITISGNVNDSRTKSIIIGAKIVVITEPSNVQQETLTNSKGEFTLSIEEGNGYDVKVSAYKYMSAESVVTDAELLQKEKQSFQLEPIIEGNTITLNHVLFERGKATLIQGSENELDLVVEMMKYNPSITIFLAGHTDNQGKSSLNLVLSEDRVKTVSRYLISKGVSKKRISGKGYGGLKPIASNAGLETRKLNRRVEFTVHEKVD
jgi:outer membrane protein OmpA-like peptidoglycan-associated protein